MMREREKLIQCIELLTDKINNELDNQPDITDENLFTDDDLREIIVHNSTLYAVVVERNFALRKLLAKRKGCEDVERES